MKRYFISIIVTVLLLTIVSACGNSDNTPDATIGNAAENEVAAADTAPEPTEIPEDTPTPEPTAVPTNTPTPEPTHTPANTPTNTPAPEPTATSTPTVAPIGSSRSNPYPRAELVTASDWEIQVIDMLRGDEAARLITQANMFNEPAPANMEYVLIKIKVKSNHSDSEEHSIDGRDFKITGDKLIEYSPARAVEPDPPLDAELFAEGETEGWAAFLVHENENNLILIFDELFSFDTKNKRFVALDDDASIVIAPELADIQPNESGKDRGSPASVMDQIVTEDYELSIIGVVRGDDAWKMVEAANMFNDAPDEGMEYLAVKVGVRDIRTEDVAESIDSSWFKSTGDVGVLYDFPSVVDPDPALDVSLFPGGKYEGWVVVQHAIGEEGLMLVFEQPFDFKGESRRFISLDGASELSAPAQVSTTSTEEDATTIPATATVVSDPEDTLDTPPAPPTPVPATATPVPATVTPIPIPETAELGVYKEIPGEFGMWGLKLYDLKRSKAVWYFGNPTYAQGFFFMPFMELTNHSGGTRAFNEDFDFYLVDQQGQTFDLRINDGTLGAAHQFTAGHYYDEIHPGATLGVVFPVDTPQDLGPVWFKVKQIPEFSIYLGVANQITPEDG